MGFIMDLCCRLQVDGEYQGTIFRKQKDLALAHEVIYQWASEMGTGSPEPWSSS